jgi:hypothetical protein
MPATFTLISSVTVGSGGAANIEFTSIPGTYTDLNLLISARSSRNVGGTDSIYLDINTVGTDRTFRVLTGNGASASSVSGSDAEITIFPQGTQTANTFGNVSIYFANYAGSNNKSFSVDSVSENNATTAYAQLFAGLWSSSAAITGLKIRSGNGFDLVQYSTAYLYGISNA